MPRNAPRSADGWAGALLAGLPNARDFFRAFACLAFCAALIACLMGAPLAAVGAFGCWSVLFVGNVMTKRLDAVLERLDRLADQRPRDD